MQYNNNSIRIDDAILLFRKELTTMINNFLEYFSKKNIHDFYRSGLPRKGEFGIEGIKYLYWFHGTSFSIQNSNGTNKIDVGIFQKNGLFIDNCADFLISVHSLQTFLRSNKLCVLLDNNDEIIGNLCELKHDFVNTYYEAIASFLMPNNV